MVKTRREFSSEFKRETVALLESNGGRRERTIGSGATTELAAAPVASGPGVGDHAIEA